MRLGWTGPARVDLAALRAWIAREDPRASRRVAERILQAADGPVRHPRLGRSGRIAGTRELVVPGLPYLLLYRIGDGAGRIQILRVIHGARQWPDRP